MLITLQKITSRLLDYIQGLGVLQISLNPQNGRPVNQLKTDLKVTLQRLKRN